MDWINKVVLRSMPAALEGEGIQGWGVAFIIEKLPFEQYMVIITLKLYINLRNIP